MCSPWTWTRRCRGACHVPSWRHVAAARRGDVRGAPLVPVSAAACATCHDAENGPAFAYGTWWPRIAHGK
jgi:hypothetical protein